MARPLPEKITLPSRFGYDAVRDVKRRRSPVSKLQSEDAELTTTERGQLVTAQRDLARNFAIAAWAIRKHLDYVSTFRFQCRTGDRDTDAAIEATMRDWSAKGACDVAARHSLRRLVRICEARATLDGDVFLMKLADGRVQAIEADRVATPTATAGSAIDLSTLVHGVEADVAGRPLRYCVCRRGKWAGALEFERMVPSENLLQHGYFDRIDQLRGVSPLAAALNSYTDVYEGLDYALAKAKVSQLFALAFYREGADELGAHEGNATDGYQVDFGKGPVQLDLDPGDRAEFLESKHPSSEFQQFCAVVIGIALKSLDIPFSFYDESHTNYSGARQAMLQYEQSAEEKRAALREDLLDPLTRWRIGLWVADGEIVLPAGVGLDQVQWEWIPAGLPWIDPLKEVEADIAAVQNGLNSPQRICKTRGQDAFEVLEEIAAWQAEAARLGVTLTPRSTASPLAMQPEK